MLVFAGYDATTDYNDTWALPLGKTPQWSLVPGSDAPPPRWGEAAVYDPAGDRLVMFSGSLLADDTWALTLAGTPSWSQLTPAGTPPVPRADFAMVYDPVGDQVVVFGGYDGYSPPANRRNDVWALSLSGTPQWSEFAPDTGGPAPRVEQSVVYDPTRDRMLVFAGYDATTDYNDTWALMLTGDEAWVELHPTGETPSLRWGHSAIYDPLHDLMIVYGGAVTQGAFICGDSYALICATPLPPTAVEVSLVSADAGPGLVRPFTLPEAAPARLELLDLAGRRMSVREVGSLGPGPHIVELTRPGTLPPGVYLLRLTSGRQTLTKRVALLR